MADCLMDDVLDFLAFGCCAGAGGWVGIGGAGGGLVAFGGWADLHFCR